MRQFSIPFLLILFALPALTHAKTNISVPRFADKTEKGPCAAQSSKAKADLDKQLQAKLIAGLMELQRFQIQEREVRKLNPEHSVVGTVRTFEVCLNDDRVQTAQIELEVQLLGPKGELTHMFSSSAKTSSTAANRAPDLAINSAVSEIIKRVDDAVPRRKSALRLTSKPRGLASNPMVVKLIPRDRR